MRIMLTITTAICDVEYAEFYVCTFWRMEVKVHIVWKSDFWGEQVEKHVNFFDNVHYLLPGKLIHKAKFQEIV